MESAFRLFLVIHPHPRVTPMNLCRLSRVATTAACFVLTCPSDPLTAQTPISGNQTGTLAAGVYHANGTITVPVGQTWTLNPGVIIKFVNAYEVTVNGTLIANGTAGNPVIFSDVADDTAGGNTNGGGVSTGSAAAWRGIVFGSTSSASVLNYTDLRYGGSGFISNIHLNSASPTFTNCVIRNCYADGMELNGNSFPTVTDCTFTNNGGFAINSAPIAAVPAITNNAATGNGGNFVHVTVGAVNSNLTINQASMITGALGIETTIAVAAGVTLTLNPGVIFKFINAYEVTVDGALVVNGTAGNPVILTDDADDSAGGNTNGGAGVSVGSPTGWRGIIFNSTSSASSLNYADLRYGGSGFISNIHLNSANPTVTNCTIRDCYADGMELNGNSFPTVTNCTFTNNGGFAINSAPIAAVPAITNNAATGNGGNFIHVTVGAVSGNVTINQTSMITGALGIETSVAVAAGATLTLNAGVIFKFMNAYEVTVDGTLVVNGTSGNPVIFTDDADDTAGGNTNGGGASTGSPTAWRGIIFNPTSSASVLNHADLRYGGSGFISNVHLNSANPTLGNCVIRNCYTDGMELNGNSFPTVSTCTFTNNGGYAVQGVDLAAVPGFRDNAASGNGGNFLHVTGANVASALTISAHSILQGALVVETSITVQPTGTLIVEQGVNFKFQNAYEVNVSGAVILKGTSYEPVAFTAYADDSIAGDTNNNGPSVGSPTAWRGFTINAGALASRLENVVIRYTGSGFIPGLTSSSPNVTLRSVRVDDAYDRGFLLAALAANPVNLVAWSCGNHGIHVTNGSFDLVHATCAGNSTGVRREAAWAGRVINSNIHGNSTNFANFVAAQVHTSNGGFPGVNGNLNQDPLFANSAAGDLHLTTGSPCLGAAEFFTAVAVQKDHDENSRILDHASSGFPLADMGAYELPTWGMTVTGAPRIGSLMHFTLTGPPGDSFIGIGILDGTVPVLPYGMLLLGSLPGGVALLFPLTIPVGIPIPLPLANDPYLIGIGAGIQTLTFPSGNLSVGNFTRLYRILIRS